jgi:hypothetical protein
MNRRAGIRTGIVVLVVLATAVVFAAVGRADDPRFDQIESSLAPSPVSASASVLYKAQWHYIDNQTLTHPSIQITLPAGWALVSPSDPAGCTQTGTTVTCARDTIRQGDFVRQSVELTTGDVLGSQTVTSTLVFFEGPKNPGRLNHVDNLPASTLVISGDASAEPNRAGKCLDDGETVSTAPNVGGSSTSARGPSTQDLCTPVSIDEAAREDPNEACLPSPYECVTDIVTTDAPAGSTDHPIKLTIVFYGNGLNNLPLIFTSQTQGPVPACSDDETAAPDPCFFGHVARQRSVTWSLNWSGVDPSWTS